MDSELSGIAEKELNWCSCTCLYPESLLLPFPSLSHSLLVLFLRCAIFEAAGFDRNNHNQIFLHNSIATFYTLKLVNYIYVEKSDVLTRLTTKIVIVGRRLRKKRIELVARQDRKKKKKDRRRPPRGWWRRAVGEGFFLALLKSPFPPPFLKASYGTRGNCEST